MSDVSQHSLETVEAIYADGVIKPVAVLNLSPGWAARLRVNVVYGAQVKALREAEIHQAQASRPSQWRRSEIFAPAPTPQMISAGRRLRLLGVSVGVREALLVLFIVGLAATLRFSHVSSLPTGLHGDEAIAGLEARRILNEGFIGPYSPSALGQPAGPLYVTALSVYFFGDTIFAVRVVSAALGTLTVLALYLFLRRNLGFNVALLGSLFLATMNWHLHFSRIGFPLAMWPLLAVLIAAALMEALRANQTRIWALAGGITSFGVYVYNAHHLFIAIAGLFVLLQLILRNDVPARRRLAWLSAFVAAGFIVALPMLYYAAIPENDYFSHFRAFSLFESSEWKALHGLGDQITLLVQRYFNYWARLSWRPELDGADGTGALGKVPIVTAAGFILAGGGLVLGLLFRRSPAVILGCLVVLMMPLGSVITIDGLARRTFALAPFAALFAALAVDEINRRARVVRGARAAAVSAILIAIFVYQDLGNYFRGFARSDNQSFVFTEELTDATNLMNSLPPGAYFYFYSDRWSFNYETRQWLAPNLRGEDRSTEFGGLNFAVNTSQGRPVFVLLGTYQKRLRALRDLYPGGETVTGRIVTGSGPSGPPTFVAYLPPFSDLGARAR